MSDSVVDFGYGWDPTAQVKIKADEHSQIAVVPTSTPNDNKIDVLKMQEAIVSNRPDDLKNLLATTTLTPGQKRLFCRLVLENFTKPLADVLKDFPWSSVVSNQTVMKAIKKNQSDAFGFMLRYLNTYQLKTVCIHLMDVNTNNAALYDKYRPHVFSRLIDEHKQEILSHFASDVPGILRGINAQKAPAHYNLAASLADLDWKAVFVSPNLYRHCSIEQTWGLGWVIKEFPSVRRQYNSVAKTQAQMIENVNQLLQKIVLPKPIKPEVSVQGFPRHGSDFFTQDFLDACRSLNTDIDRLMGTVRLLEPLYKSHSVTTQHILMAALKSPTVDTTGLDLVLQQMYVSAYGEDIPLPMHMLATPVEKVLFNSSNPSSVMNLLGSSSGRDALREHFKNPIHLRAFANHASSAKMDLNKVVKHMDVFRDECGNTLMHFIARGFFEHMADIKRWVVDPRFNWEEKNNSAFSPKEIAYQRYGSYTESLLTDAEDIFNERANNILNSALKKQLIHKKSPSSIRKI